MSKNKLSKFADMATYPHVFQPEGESPTLSADFKMKGRWGEEFFHNSNPIVLELGCGRGEYTVGLARLFPDKNFIGVDIKGARMWTGATEALNEGLANVAFVRTRIEFIERFFAAGEVSELWLTFSDPQMKKPTKRLTSTYFLLRYRKFLRDGGLIHVKTDSNFLFTYTDQILQHNGIKPIVRTADLYGEVAKSQSHKVAESQSCEEKLWDSATLRLCDLTNIQTYYEQQWLARGIPIKYISFPLAQDAALSEPDVEIELDDYRSYARSKRSSLNSHS